MIGENSRHQVLFFMVSLCKGSYVTVEDPGSPKWNWILCSYEITQFLLLVYFGGYCSHYITQFYLSIFFLNLYYVDFRTEFKKWIICLDNFSESSLYLFKILLCHHFCESALCLFGFSCLLCNFFFPRNFIFGYFCLFFLPSPIHISWCHWSIFALLLTITVWTSEVILLAYS